MPGPRLLNWEAMKATHDIPNAMPTNEGLFTDPFLALRAAPLAAAPETDGFGHQAYKFPTFYRDVTCAIGIFLCDYEKARRALPDPLMRPVRMPRGRAAVAFSCYEYKQVMNVAPYNEIAMTIPVLFDAPVDVPVAPLLLGSRYPGFGYYVFSMPVTSRENQLRGNRLWGLPKVTQDIDTREDGVDFVTTAYEEKGEPYFELRVPMDGKPTSFDVGADLFSQLEDVLSRAAPAFRQLNVVKHMGQLFRRGGEPDRKYLERGSRPERDPAP